MARNPEGTGRLIIWLVRIHCGQVSTGKYTRSSARLAVDSVGSSAEKRDRVRSTRGSRVIRPWHREIHASRVEAIAMRPTRSRQRTLPVWYVFFESRVENSPREVEKRLGTVRWEGSRRKAGYRATDALWTVDRDGDIFIPRAIERAGAGWISNPADRHVSLSRGKEDGCFEPYFLEMIVSGENGGIDC